MRARLHLTIRQISGRRGAAPNEWRAIAANSRARGFTLVDMALRIHPMSASRWEELSATRLPIDLTKEEQIETQDRSRRMRGEVEQIQAYVDALDARRTTASR